MKKRSLILLVLCAFLLCACGSSERISGTVTEISQGSDLLTFSFILTAEDGRRFLVTKAPMSSVFSLSDGFDSEDFCAGNFREVTADVRPASFIWTRSVNGEKIRSFKAESIVISGYLSPEGCTLSDGTVLDIWQRFDSTVYCLQNGMELLSVQNPSGPEHSYSNGVASLDDLDSAASERIVEYYRALGLMYDVDAELEKSYTRYLSMEVPWFYQPGQIYQYTSPTASNEDILYFLTSVSLPTEDIHTSEIRLGAAFDRQSGRFISNAELFTCPPETLIATLLDFAGVDDEKQRNEMIAAFDMENLVIFPDNVEISFPSGTLPEVEHLSIMVFDYSDELLGLMQPWALPENLSENG